MSNIDKLTVISTDGASAVVKSATDAVAQGMQVAEDVTGVNVSGLLATAIANAPALAQKKA
jgi:flotillin